MPQPPKQGESKQAFISRCIAYLIENEGKTQDQAAGQCYGMWDNRKRRKVVRIRKKSKV